MSKINVKTSPLSAKPTKKVEETMAKVLDEMDQIIRKYGLDAYLLVVKNPGKDTMYSSVFFPSDITEAEKLMQHAAQTYFELKRTETPTGPGGIA